MSRHISTVKATALFEVLGEDAPKKLNKPGLFVHVAHGYDAPCTSYFLDLMPDCEIGIYYGGIGLTRPLSKSEYVESLVALDLLNEAEQVALDLPY